MSAPKLKTVPIEELSLDPGNANLGTDRGRKLLESSMKKYGMGRSILVDKNNRVIAGNKSLQQAIALGKTQVVVVEADENTLIAVKRADLDLQTDSRAQGLAISDRKSVLYARAGV